MARGDYAPRYVERELTAPANLCDAGGRLDPSAVGWSRRPLVRANLSGSWPRKKRWNFWNWISPELVLSLTLADVDYGAFCSVAFHDLETGDAVRHTWLGLPGRVGLPERVEESVAFEGGGISYAHVDRGAHGIEVALAARGRGGPEIAAELAILRGERDESLNVVVPWSARRFQLNSKHAALPCAGVVRVGARRIALDPARCHAVQDWGRGVWPYRSFWNWGVCTGEQDGVRIGVNMGAKWTTGTGSNENGILIDGRLHKVMEDLRWDYAPGDWRKPWRVRAELSGAIDLTLEPRHPQITKLDLGLLATGGVCCFGRWSGRITVDGGVLEVRDLLGWAEEFSHRW